MNTRALFTRENCLNFNSKNGNQEANTENICFQEFFHIRENLSVKEIGKRVVEVFRIDRGSIVEYIAVAKFKVLKLKA